MEDKKDNGGKKRMRLKPTYEECAIRVLEDFGRAMSHQEIFQEATKIRPLGGKTPLNSAYSILYRSKRIISIGNGMFDLQERVED